MLDIKFLIRKLIKLLLIREMLQQLKTMASLAGFLLLTGCINIKCLAMNLTTNSMDNGLNKNTSASNHFHVAAFTAAASIQVNYPKPKHIESLQTVLLNMTIESNSVNIKWKFLVITRNRTKRQTDAFIVPEKRSLEWIIRLRKYGTLNIRVYRVADENNILDDERIHNKTYDYIIEDLEAKTAYELCIQSKHHTISDKMESLINSKATINHSPSNQKYTICKEIVTLSSTRKNTTELAMAATISSASTTLIIIVLICCCRSKRRDVKQHVMLKRGQVGCRKSIKYQRIWRWLDKSPQRSSISLSSNCNNNHAKRQQSQHAIIPVVNHKSNSNVTYINPNDIKCITSSKKMRIFSRGSKPLCSYIANIRTNNNDTIGNKFKMRYGRPNSWPEMKCMNTSGKSQSTTSISSMPTSTMWFRSLSSSHKSIRDDKNDTNVDFV